MLGVGAGELILLLVVGLLVLGPERLPRFAAQAGRFLHTLRTMAQDAREEVRATLGPELRDLDLDVDAWADAPARRVGPTPGAPAPGYDDAT